MKLSTTWHRWTVCLLLTVATLFFVGCETLEQAAPLPETESNNPPLGSIGSNLQIGDLLKIEFSSGTIQLPVHEEHIKDDGTVTLDLIGAIQAAGKTVGELQKEIQKAYVPKYYRNLTVTVKGSDLFYYTGGEVKSPGRQLYLGPITVTGAIKSAGDFTDFAKKTQVKLIRANGKILIINAIKAQEKTELDLPIYPGDKIDVPRRFW